jgi:chaperone BCS1
VKASLTNDNTRYGSEEKTTEEKLQLQHYSDIFILQYKGKRLLINKGREKFENASDIRNAFYNNFRVEGWFAKQKIAELFTEVIDYNKSIRKVRQTIYTNNIYGDWMNFGEIYGKSIENIVLKEKQEIVDNIADFISKEAWYSKRGLSYKRGYLFYGSPGNGKTSLCLALAKHFNRDIQFLNLNDIEKDSNLFVSFNNIRNNSILVIEDVDAVFGTREGKSKISFSALLNCMDGAFSKYGIITIMTTNHADRIDDALIREGRIDMKIKIDNPEKEMVEEYLTMFYGKEAELDEYENTISMSRIQELCLQNKDNLQETLNLLLPDKAKRGEKKFNLNGVNAQS